MSLPENANVDLYTRNGFAGPLTTVARASYSPDYTRVVGTYCPQRLDPSALGTLGNSGDLPITVLHSATARLDVWRRDADTPFAIRDVRHDQLLCVEHGTARLETDFGVLELEPLDMVLLPRAVSYRLSRVESLRMTILVTPERLYLDPDIGDVLDLDVHVHGTRPYEPGEVRSGEQELVVRHGDAVTSYFYDYDPLAVLQVEGAPVVQRFNLGNVTPPPSTGPFASPPSRLVCGDQTESLVFYLGAREASRPPVHHNADYDEVVVFSRGPGAWGHLTTPGTMVWVPKGLIHRGPEENVPEGYIAWLLESRVHFEATPAGKAMGELMETDSFDVHPSVKTASVSTASLDLS